MRTGRKGYYKRTQAVDKTTTMKITVHDSEDSIGADRDLHTRVFSKSSKALQHREASVDALDLPFFQLGRHPNQVQPVKMLCDPPRVPLAIAAAPGQGSNEPLAVDIVDEVAHDSDSDRDLPSAMNPMQMIHHVIPSMSKDKAEAKAKAASIKAKAKAAAPKSSSAEPSKKKRKGQGDENHEPSGTATNPPKIMRLQTSKQGSAKPPAVLDRTTSLDTDADKKLMAEYNELLTNVKKNALSSLGDSDAVINDNLKSASKDIATLLKKLREKRKSLKRRQDEGGALIVELDDMIAEAGNAQAAVSALLHSHGDSDVVASLKNLTALHWNVSGAMYRKAFKCQTLAYLKFSDWSAFSASRESMHQELGVTNGEVLFECMTSEIIQRLLRSLPMKVSINSIT